MTGRSAELHIASYNIHRCIGTDGRCDAERIVQVIRELHCDTIGLQEIDNVQGDHPQSMQLDFIASATGMTPVAGLRIIRREGEYGNALLTLRPILSVVRHDVSYLRREPRGVLDVRLDIGGTPTRILLTHLGLMPIERRFQVKRLLEIAAGGPSNEPVVLLGDINEWFPRGRPLRWLHAHFGCPTPVKTFPSFWPLLSLDRIWAHPSAALREIAAHRTELSRVASDHLPVKAVIDTTVSQNSLRQ